MSSTSVPTQKQEIRALRRVSSLVLNAPDVIGPRSDAEEGHGLVPSKLKEIGLSSVESIPDSEEERTRDKRRTILLNASVVEISSDEGEDGKENLELLLGPLFGNRRGPSPINSNPSKSRNPIHSDTTNSFGIPGNDLRTLDQRFHLKSSPKIRIIRSRQVVQSSGSEDSGSDSNVVELSDSSPERPTRVVATPGPKATPGPVQRHPTVPTNLLLYVDEDKLNYDDGSILILNEPKSARKPIRLAELPGSPAVRSKGPIEQAAPRNEGFPDLDSSASESDDDVTSTPVLGTPSRANPSPTKQKGPRQSKTARALAEQKRREAYAQRLFQELNRDVFNNGLSNETELIWNKRLLTTAGRAKWHKNREGVETTAVELAVKILDCDERIRNTLSHEMCHLATWYIDGQSKEGHGNVWKGWAAKVMRKRPDIVISTKHNYEITYPYEWKCEKCGKIYGRFSKSIHPDECVCGACKVGKLIPLFTVRHKGTPKTNADSRMAADKPQDSPCSISRRLPRPDDINIVPGTTTHLSTEPIVCLVDDTSDDEVEILAEVLGGRLTLAD